MSVTIACYCLPLAFPNPRECYELTSILFNIILCSVGFAMTVIAIAFAFNKSTLFEPGCKFYFIDAFLLFIIDIMFGLLYLIKEDEFALLFIVSVVMLQLYLIFHYYFKQIFLKSKNDENEESVKESVKEIIIRIGSGLFMWIIISSPVIALYFTVDIFWAYWVMYPCLVIGFWALKEFYVESVKENKNKDENGLDSN